MRVSKIKSVQIPCRAASSAAAAEFAGFVSALSRGGLCARPGERGCLGYSTVMVFVRPQTEISCTPASSVNSIVTMRNWPASSAMNFEAINSSPS